MKPLMTTVWAALNTEGRDNQFIYVQQINRPLNWAITLVGDNPQDFVRTIHIDPQWSRSLFQSTRPRGEGRRAVDVAGRGIAGPDVLTRVHHGTTLCTQDLDAGRREVAGLRYRRSSRSGQVGSVHSFGSHVPLESLVESPTPSSHYSMGTLQASWKGRPSFALKTPRSMRSLRSARYWQRLHGATLAQIHLWSERNSLADALSRLSWSPILPTVLVTVQCDNWPKDKFE